VGNDKQRTFPGWDRLGTRFLDALAKAGYPRETIDIVLCTHLHADHIGWNTMLVAGRWEPTFPNAQYLICGHTSVGRIVSAGRAWRFED
jgi:glyoxylase-like metal-dependent hydrolase (beta-lactamase superfamily II)